MEGLAEAELHARVVDFNGEVLPGIPIKATAVRLKGESPLELSKSASADGWALLKLPGNHDYKIVVEYPGFVRRSGVITLANGCRTEMIVSLKVKAPSEIIEASHE